jgi:hypothetical protein
VFPMNIAIVTKERKRTIPYSQMKISEKRALPNSVLNPDTSSDSPSVKSNGVRPLSARDMNIHPMKNRGLVNIIHMFVWCVANLMML